MSFEIDTVQGGRIGRLMTGLPYLLLTHAEYWNERAGQERRPVWSREQAAEIQRVARKAALATGVLTAAEIEQRKSGISITPQHIDDDVALVSIRAMIVVCLEAPDYRSPTVAYYRNYMRKDARARRLVDQIAAGDDLAGEAARAFLKPQQIREDRERSEQAAKLAEAAAAAEERARVAAAEAEANAVARTIDNPDAAEDLGERAAVAFSKGGAHGKQLDVRAGAQFCLVVLRDKSSAPEVLVESALPIDWDGAVRDAEAAKLAALYLYQRNAAGMECRSRWPARAK
jgi:hypothetical protein